MKDYWLTYHDSDNEELAYQFASNKNSEAYKILKITSNWSVYSGYATKASVSNLHSKTVSLKKMINKEIVGSQGLTDTTNPTDENKLIVKNTLPKKLSELITSNETVDIIIQIIKKQDKKKPNYDISKNEINSLGYNFMGQNKNKDALKLFKLNIELYPNDFNTYDSYGECLLKIR